MPLPRVLVIEDVEEFHDSYRRRLDGKVEVVSALNVEQAKAAFERYRFAAIAVDACLGTDRPNTVALVEEFRRSYGGPMVAISGDLEFRHQLLDAGCNYECEKIQFPALILIVLEIGSATGGRP